MKRNQKLLEPESVSPSGTTRSDFEFPVTAFRASPSDVVFCGKVITRRTEPTPAPQQIGRESKNPIGGANRFVAGLRWPSNRESQCRRSDSGKKSYKSVFGMVKFPLQMELSDIKIRQERRESMQLPKFPPEEGGEESCWELIRPLQRRGTLLSTLLAKATFGCIPIV